MAFKCGQNYLCSCLAEDVVGQFRTTYIDAVELMIIQDNLHVCILSK